MSEPEKTILEFFAYETVGCGAPNAGTVYTVELEGGDRLLFPTAELRDAFLAMTPEARLDYLRNELNKA